MYMYMYMHSLHHLSSCGKDHVLNTKHFAETMRDVTHRNVGPGCVTLGEDELLATFNNYYVLTLHKCIHLVKQCRSNLERMIVWLREPHSHYM